MHPWVQKFLSSTGAGVWRKAPIALPDSSSVLDKFQSANPVALHCRATFCRITFSMFWRGVAGESRCIASKGPVAHAFSALEGVSHIKLPLRRCRGTRGGPQKCCDHSVFWAFCFATLWKSAKGIPIKGIGRNSLKVKKSNCWVFSGCFQETFRELSGNFQGAFSVLSGCFQGIFPYPLCGYPLWTLPNPVQRVPVTRARYKP